MEIEWVTKELNDTERREINLEGNNSQINPSTEIHNETIKEELFETTMGGSTRQPITTYTNNKSRSGKIPAPKVATEQKRITLVETTEKNEGGDRPNRSTASTLPYVTEWRY